MSDHLSPLTVAEVLLGGIEEVSRISGRGTKAAYHWRHPNTFRAPGDVPSVTVMRSLLAYAAAHGIPLKPEHLIWGAPAAEVEEMLQHMAAGKTEAAE